MTRFRSTVRKRMESKCYAADDVWTGKIDRGTRDSEGDIKLVKQSHWNNYFRARSFSRQLLPYANDKTSKQY